MTKKVFVSGCYDMLHSGHVAFFKEAASHGDLYVGLGSDKTIFDLKGRKTVNNNEERLFMVRSIRYVKDAWINSGSGIMDFEKEVLALQPDIFFVNTDGYTPAKQKFCDEHNIRLIVNRVSRKLFSTMSVTVDDVMDTAGLPLIGVVPEDQNVTLAAAFGRALITYTNRGAAKACEAIARRLEGRHVPLSIFDLF